MGPNKISPQASNFQKGQAQLEILVAVPILIFLISGLVGIFAFQWIRNEVSISIQEYGICALSEKHISICRMELQKNLSRLPGQIQVQTIQNSDHQVKAKLRWNWGNLKYVWNNQERIPWPK